MKRITAISILQLQLLLPNGALQRNRSRKNTIKPSRVQFRLCP
ncbi:MAG TPA: hypothetical protein VGF61_17660 [Candidatus Acidoferrum sp.]|jgi:hypothetical protein